MAKVSIGLRGWRFDEEAVFTPDGEFRPIEEIPPADRDRLRRLTVLVEAPCYACWAIHGDEAIDRCNVPGAVWGEPFDEVLVCPDHELDFRYWFQEAGGDEHIDTGAFRDAFLDWFRAGNRAPEAYEPIEHVDTNPTDLPRPSPPNPDDVVMPPPTDGPRINLRDYPRREE